MSPRPRADARAASRVLKRQRSVKPPCNHTGEASDPDACEGATLTSGACRFNTPFPDRHRPHGSFLIWYRANRRATGVRCATCQWSPRAVISDLPRKRLKRAPTTGVSALAARLGNSPESLRSRLRSGEISPLARHHERKKVAALDETLRA
jgi:hypothetical protein